MTEPEQPCIHDGDTSTFAIHGTPDDIVFCDECGEVIE